MPTKTDIAAIPGSRSRPIRRSSRPSSQDARSSGSATPSGLTQFGVNITRIKAGSASALRHTHEAEDEFIYMLEGELVLAENDGETVLRAGRCGGLQGRQRHCALPDQPVRPRRGLSRGRNAREDERVHYPDVDFFMERDEHGRRWFRKSGEPIKE